MSGRAPATQRRETLDQDPRKRGAVLDGGARFEVACSHSAMQLVVDRIRDTDAAVMTEHLQRHPDLGLSETAALGSVLDHFRVTPVIRRVKIPPQSSPKIPPSP